jgi:thiamine-phosphate pyrophosphorylase
LRCAADAGGGLVQAAATALHPVARRRDIALLLDGGADLLVAAGADGVHLMQAADYARARRRVADGIVGVGCASRDEAMSVAEAGADYVLFGDLDDAEPTAATLALVEWWSALMTMPCIGAGGTRPHDHAALARAGADFVAVGSRGWSHPGGLSAYLQDFAGAV